MSSSKGSAGIAATLVLLLAAACSGADTASTSSPSTALSPTSAIAPSASTLPPPTEAPLPPIDPDLLTSHVALVDLTESEGAAMVVVIGADGGVAHAVAGADQAVLNAATPIRIASITKVCTALVVLGFVDEGRVDLDTPASDYVTRVPVPEEVTVRDLLQHTSGIPEFTEDADLLDSWFAGSDRVWTPEEVVAVTTEMPRAFPPGSEWYWGYSNTNYVILGVLIEEIEGRPFHRVLRARLFDPLGMDGTYLEGFEEGPAPPQGYYSPTFMPPAQPVDFPYTAIATSAWAAGGLVSTARDLHTLLTGVFDGSVVSEARLEDMFEDPRAIPVPAFGVTASYGLGVQVFERFAGRQLDGFVGHMGDVPGSVVIAAHQRDSGSTIVWAVTNNLIDPSPMLYPVAEAVAGR